MQRVRGKTVMTTPEEGIDKALHYTFAGAWQTVIDRAVQTVADEVRKNSAIGGK
jgi:hypothetical protein